MRKQMVECHVASYGRDSMQPQAGQGWKPKLVVDPCPPQARAMHGGCPLGKQKDVRMFDKALCDGCVQQTAPDSSQSPDSGVLKGTSSTPGDTWPSSGQAMRFLGS